MDSENILDILRNALRPAGYQCEWGASGTSDAQCKITLVSWTAYLKVCSDISFALNFGFILLCPIIFWNLLFTSFSVKGLHIVCLVTFEPFQFIFFSIFVMSHSTVD
jgi:hypothetical protein